MRCWYVINTHARSESKAVFHLQRQGFETYLPVYLKRRTHARKVDWLRSPIFPRYFFARFDAELEQWRTIRSTVGVNQIICNGEAPTPVPEGIVEEIKRREDEDGLVQLSRVREFKKGDKVRILHDALLDQVGIFDYEDHKRRVFVLLNLMGREVKVAVNRDTVAANG